MSKDPRIKIVLALYMTTFLAAIEGTIVSTAMPIITTDLLGSHLFSWVNTIYLLAMVVATPIFGKLSDIYGRKQLIIIGTVLFTVGSFLSGIAWDMISLIIFRAIQGFGGAALLTLPMVIITDLYALEQRSKIQGWLSSIWGIAGILGPVAGGLLVDFVSWRSIFYINVPFAIIALIMLYRHMPKQKSGERTSIDGKGITTFTIGILLLMIGLNQIFSANNSSVMTISFIICIIIGLVMLSWFIQIERNRELKSLEVFMPLQVFTNRQFLFIIITGFVISIINIAIIFYIPLWIQHFRGQSATFSGSIMIPLSIFWPLGSIVAGNFVVKLGIKRMILLGSIFLCIGSIGFALMSSNITYMQMIIYISCSGFAFGILLTSLMILSTMVAQQRTRGAGLSAAQLFRTLGQAFGLVIFDVFLYSDVEHLQYAQYLHESIVLIFKIIAALSVLLTIYMIYMSWTAKDEYAAIYAGQKSA